MQPRPWRPFSRAEIDALFAETRRADPFGMGLHTFAACAFCVSIGFPTTFPEWAGLTLLVVWAVRMISHHRTLGPLFWEPAIWLLAAWAGWLALSALWSPGARSDITGDFATLHWGAAAVALYPVLDRRRWLIGALIVGVLCGNLSQVSQALGTRLDWPLPTWNRFADRNSGWWDPVVGGSILVTALGIHLAALSMGRSVRERALGLAGCLITGLAILATGTRGAWIGMMIVTAAALVIGGWMWLFARRTPESAGSMPRANAVALRRGRTIAAAGAALGVVVALIVGWLTIGPSVSKRFNEARAELSRALNDHDYSTFTGARIAMWGRAWDEFRAHPIRGVGAGGYRAAKLAETPRIGPPSTPVAPAPPLHAHAHSWPFHTAATTGLIGFALAAGLVGWCIASGLRRDLKWAAAVPARSRWELGYDAGPALGLIGLCAAGLFDSIAINSQTACLWIILTAVCVRCRPSQREA